MPAFDRCRNYSSDKCKVTQLQELEQELAFRHAVLAALSSDPHFSTIITHVHDKKINLSKNTSPSFLHTEKIEIRIFLTSNSCWPWDQYSSIVLYGIWMTKAVVLKLTCFWNGNLTLQFIHALPLSPAPGRLTLLPGLGGVEAMTVTCCHGFLNEKAWEKAMTSLPF